MSGNGEPRVVRHAALRLEPDRAVRTQPARVDHRCSIGEPVSESEGFGMRGKCSSMRLRRAGCGRSTRDRCIGRGDDHADPRPGRGGRRDDRGRRDNRKRVVRSIPPSPTRDPATPPASVTRPSRRSRRTAGPMPCCRPATPPRPTSPTSPTPTTPAPTTVAKRRPTRATRPTRRCSRSPSPSRRCQLPVVRLPLPTPRSSRTSSAPVQRRVHRRARQHRGDSAVRDRRRDHGTGERLRPRPRLGHP